MKKLFACLFSLSLFATSAHSAFIDLPTIGFGQWEWGEAGNLIDLDRWGSGQFSHAFSLDKAGYVSFVADDIGLKGDAFGLILDNKARVWTETDHSTGAAGEGYFHGVYTAFLSAGVHAFQLDVVQDCCGNGGMYWGIGLGKIAPDLPDYVPSIPEPETYAMLLVGLGLLGFTARRRN